MRCLYQAKLRVCDDPSMPSVAEVDISPLHKMKDGIERSEQDEKHAHIGLCGETNAYEKGKGVV